MLRSSQGRAEARVQDFFDTAPNGMRLHEALPDGSCVTFVLSHDDGAPAGVWTVTRRGDQPEVALGESEVADCRLVCTVDDFAALLEGRLDPRAGYLSGRLKVTGDVGLVLSLHRLIARRTESA